VLTRVGAQSLSATPAVANIAASNLPGKVPEGWKAEGWSQSDWNALYQQCLNIPTEATRRAHMSPEQLRGFKPIPGDWEGCKHIFSAVSSRPAAAPTTTAALGIPEKPPQFWTADGGTQGQWTALRKRCADIRSELARRQSMSDKQLETSPGLSFSRDEMLLCFQLHTGKAMSGPAPSPLSVPPAIKPTPMKTPPAPLPVGP